MQQKFDLQEQREVVKAVFEQLNRQYRNYRHKLHIYYEENKEDDEKDIFEHPPTGVSSEDWETLINYFESDEFKVYKAQHLIFLMLVFVFWLGRCYRILKIWQVCYFHKHF